MRRKPKVMLKKRRAEASAKNIPEKINEFDNDAAKEHVKLRNKIIESSQQVEINDLNKSCYDSDHPCFSVTCLEEQIYSPILEDLLTELNISKPEKESYIEENDSFPPVCSYCGHISKIPKNLIKSVHSTDSVQRTLSPFAKCTIDLNFIQAIVWLKSIAARMHEIPLEKYNLIFNVSTKAAKYNVSECQKEIIKSNCAFSDKQFSDKDLLNIVCNKSKYNAQKLDLHELNKEHKGCEKINHIEDSLYNSSLTPQRWTNTCTMNKRLSQSLIVPESDEEFTANSEIVEDSIKDISVDCNNTNISAKRDSAYETWDISQNSIDLFDTVGQENQNKCFQKKRKIEIENTSRKKNKYITEIISTEWVNFTLSTLETNNVVIESVKIILTIFKEMNIIKEYLKHKNWVNTLEKEALDVILNISNIFRIEMKSDIYIKEIIQTVKDILEEIYEGTDLSKVTLQIYHMSIILEFCDSLYICNEIIDYLMIKLQHFQTILNNILTKKLNGLHNIISKVHLVLYALSICLQKYMNNIRNNKNNSKEDAIPAVINLWRKQWNIDRVYSQKIKEQKNIESWANSLEVFIMTYIDDVPLLAEKSRQLYHILIT